MIHKHKGMSVFFIHFVRKTSQQQQLMRQESITRGTSASAPGKHTLLWPELPPQQQASGHSSARESSHVPPFCSLQPRFHIKTSEEPPSCLYSTNVLDESSWRMNPADKSLQRRRRRGATGQRVFRAERQAKALRLQRTLPLLVWRPGMLQLCLHLTGSTLAAGYQGGTVGRVCLRSCKQVGGLCTEVVGR